MKNYKKLFPIVIIIILIFLIISCKPNLQNSINSETLAQGSLKSQNTNQSGDNSNNLNNIVLQNPKSSIISSLKLPGQAIDLKVSGDFIYITNDLGYLYVIDIKDKKNPAIIGKCSGIDAANIVFIESDYVYVSYSKYDFQSKDLKVNYGFKIIDIKDKRQPKVIGDWGFQSNAVDKSVHGIYVKNNYVYVTIVSIEQKKSSSVFQIIDVSNKTKPELKGSINFDGSTNAVWVENDYAYINSVTYQENIENTKTTDSTTQDSKQIISNSYLNIVNIKDKTKPLLISKIEVPSESWGLYVNGDYAYLSSNNYNAQDKKYYNSAVQIVGIKDKSNPKLLGSCNIKGGAWELDFSSDYLFVSNLNGGFYTIDVKDKQNPKIIDFVKTKGSTYDIVIFGNFGYLADGFEGLRIFEIKSQGQETQNLNTENQKNENNINKNNPPVAVIDVSGDEINYDSTTDTYTFSLGNPIYFSGLGSFDPDGDDLKYTWDIKDSEKSSNNNSNKYLVDSTNSKDKLSVIFKEIGDYEVSLSVSDGNLTNIKKKTIKIVPISTPINIIKDHKFTVEIITKITNNTNYTLKNLECFIKAPQNFLPFQEVLDLSSNSNNQEILFDNDFNKVLHFKYDTLNSKESFSAVLKCKVDMPELSLKKITSSQNYYDKNDPDLKLYTTEDLFIDSDSNEIISAAKSVIGNESDPIIKAKKLYNFVVAKLDYDYERAKDKNYKFYYASEILKIGKGVCADYAILYTALLRASGIPSRISAGVPVEAVINAKDSTLDFGHAWVEVKLPGYGWIPIDVTSEDNFMPRELYLNLSTERGSSFLHKSVTMDWYSYFFDGFNYTWEGTEKPDVIQDISYKVDGLQNSDLSIYSK